MKTKLTLLALALMGLAFTSCSDDNTDDPGLFPPNVTESMKEKLNESLHADFPFTKNKTVEWKSDTQNKCFKAEFKGEDGFSDVEAWYTHTYNLVMTEFDYGKNVYLAPAGLNDAFNKTDYATWTIDDISYYRFPTEPRSFYEIEVEKAGNPDTYLYFRIDTNPQTKEKVYQLYKTSTQDYTITPSFDITAIR